MNRTTTRLLTVAALVVGVHLLFLVVQRQGMPTEIRSPARDPHQLPMDLPPEAPVWKGEEIELDPEIFVGTDAEAVVDRSYRDTTGHRIALHIAVVTKYFMTLRHHPKHCYTVHGSELVEEKSVDLEFPDKSSMPVQLMVMESDGRRFLVLYWFQLGDKIIFNGGEQRKARWELRGKRTWPPLIKVLLQTPVGDPERTEERLLNFAKLVYSWTKDLDRQPAVDRPAE